MEGCYYANNSGELDPYFSCPFTSSFTLWPWLTPFTLAASATDMATTDSRKKIRRRDVFVNLAEELQLRRSGVHSAKMAENLFRFEEGRDLVGVGHEAKRAIYYETASRSLVAVQFDKHGVYAGEKELLQCEINDPTVWIETYGSRLVWVHPQYR